MCCVMFYSDLFISALFGLTQMTSTGGCCHIHDCHTNDCHAYDCHTHNCHERSMSCKIFYKSILAGNRTHGSNDKWRSRVSLTSPLPTFKRIGFMPLAHQAYGANNRILIDQSALADYAALTFPECFLEHILGWIDPGARVNSIVSIPS